VNALAVDPFNRSIYAATSGKSVFKSVDGGTTWIEAGLPGLEVKTILVQSASTVLAGALDGGLQKTTDGGAKWIDTGAGEKYINALAADPSRPSLVYAAVGSGLLKSVDGGTTWAKTNLPASLARAVTVQPKNPDTLYVGVAGGRMYKSTDGGQNWKAINNPQQIYVVNHLVATESAVYAATGIGVLKSTDGGENWTPINSGLPTHPSNNDNDVRSIGVDPSNPSVLYVGTFGAGVFKTTSGGEKWEAAGSL